MDVNEPVTSGAEYTHLNVMKPEKRDDDHRTHAANTRLVSQSVCTSINSWSESESGFALVRLERKLTY